MRDRAHQLIPLFLFAATLAAQVGYETAALEGNILDSQDKPIAGARITVINQASGASRTAASTADGYQILALAPGTYRIEVEADGFEKSIVRDLTLAVGQTVKYDIRLMPGAISTVLDVVVDLPLLQPEQTQQANVINNNQVENLPNIGRNFVESLYTVPGVTNSFAPAIQDPGVGTAYLSSGFSIGGSNGRGNLITIDGGENDYGSGTLRTKHVPIDSIQEFQINRSAFEAEFGFTIGSAINMVTKSGANKFSGSASVYFHDHALDSVNYFNHLADPSQTPFEQSAIFSATLGGPIRRNRLFFFTAPEFQKLDSASVQNIAGEGEFQGVASQPNGYNSATGQCPGQNTAAQQVSQLCYLTQLANSGSPLSPLGAGLLASPVFGNPLSNPILNALVSRNDGTFDGILSGTNVRGIPGFNTPRGRYANWVSRLDYIPDSRDTFALRFSFMHENDAVSPQPPYSTFEHVSDYTITGSWTRVWGSNLVNTVRVQVVPRSAYSLHAPAPNGSEIDLGNQIALGTPFGAPYDADWKRLQFDDSLTWVKGAHRFKFGGSYRPDYYDVVNPIWTGGEWKFTDGTFSILNIVGASQGTAVANALAAYNLSQGYPAGGPPSTNLTAVQAYLAGTPTVLFQADPKSNAHWSAWAQSLGLYAQDSWKATQHLTVNYGVRLDYSHQPSPVPQNAFVSPRLGFAWSPDRKTVVRVGSGLFVAPTIFMIPYYSNLLGDSGKYINQNALVAPLPSIFAAWALQSANATPAFPNPALTDSQLASIGVTISPPGPAAYGNIIYTIGPNFRPEYTIQASASAAREIAHRLTLELGYLMYRSVHIEQVVEANFVRSTSTPVDPFAGPAYVPAPGFTAGEPNSSIFQNNAYSSVGTGIYNGGTASLTRSFDKGLQFQVNYTFSRAIDDTSDFSSLSTPFRPDLLNLDRALSDFNVTHNFVANAVYALPFHKGVLSGITVSPILYARSGIPFTLLVPGLENGTIGINANARPWYEGRNLGIGPDYVSFDLRISKILFQRESGSRGELIFQSQNLLNRTNFAEVNNNFPVNPSYALSNGGTLENGPWNVQGFAPTSVAQLSTPLAFTAAFPPRQISLALELAF